ncbi:MAG: 16S rRNA (adenine(1518)-N(6)/adenine(1519)-N(6))-dimethyltransferase RsmA [Clostridia bacterium]|nr:16S rRNA (adenine(1518)-N(6)/adenine(1519)-N(6))-dimethyltransferase RsmA [Clostridia bacterium]
MALGINELKALFEAHGRRANRALGQNFFIDHALLEQAVETAAFAQMPILEIGPGLGALTEPLLNTGNAVTAVEKDAFLAERLPELLPTERLTVVNGDILKQDIPALVGAEFSAAGNLPYYITTPIVTMLLKLLPDTMLLMTQKEAAARFFARPGDRVYGPVAILTALYYDAKELCELDPAQYWPQPDVRSSVTLLKRKRGAALPAPAGLLRFSDNALAQRRKTLINALGKTEQAHAALEAVGLSPAVRAETLDPETFLALYTAMQG